MITEDYCDFETAKLLKEKDFDIPCREHYYQYGELSPYSTEYNNWNGEENYYSCPTLQMAMKWLRETYNIHIVPYFDKLQNSDDLSYSFTLYLVSEHCETIEKIACFDIDENYYWKYPEQACEVAIKYCLENLI